MAYKGQDGFPGRKIDISIMTIKVQEHGFGFPHEVAENILSNLGGIKVSSVNPNTPDKVLFHSFEFSPVEIVEDCGDYLPNWNGKRYLQEHQIRLYPIGWGLAHRIFFAGSNGEIYFEEHNPNFEIFRIGYSLNEAISWLIGETKSPPQLIT